MTMSAPDSAAGTLPFEKFWAWLQAHQNCILRAGTPDAVLFDHEDFHWHLCQEEDGAVLLQVVRGKDLVGELVVLTQEIAYVQTQMTGGDEVVFECIVETPTAQEAAYHFVMAHDYDEAESPPTRRWTH